MKLRLLAAAVVLVALAYLAFRVVVLEERVAGLEGELSVAAGELEARRRPTRKTERRGRLAALEESVERLKSQIEIQRAQARLNEPGANPKKDEPEKLDSRIRETLNSEINQMFDKHIDFHRDNLLRMRTPAFDQFVEAAELSDGQRQQVWQELETESDELADLFRDPGLRADPSLANTAVHTILDQTDERVARFLQGSELEHYLTMRRLERAALPPPNVGAAD